MSSWIENLKTALSTQGRCALVTMTQVKGSTPREPGAKMVVWQEGFDGSVGGGKLEFEALARARARLADPDAAEPTIERYALGPSLGQCCGGSTSLLFEVMDESALGWLDPLQGAAQGSGDAVLASRLDGDIVAKTTVTGEACRGATLPEEVAAAARQSLASSERLCRIVPGPDRSRFLLEPLPEARATLALFGAGHVGQALVRVLGGQSFDLIWIDERAEIFPDSLPRGVTAMPAAAPALVAERLPEGSYVLVMTHSHDRDYEIVEAMMRRADFAYLGLIGSDSKRARCLKRLRALEIPEVDISRLTSPIGLPGIEGKLPEEIAIAVAAQLLQLRDSKPS